MASRTGLGRLWQWLGIVLVAVVVWQLIPANFWPYLFFLRVPCLAVLVLLLFPWIALGPLQALLANLLVLRGPWQLFFVILGTLAAGMTTSSVATVILGNASVRFLSSAAGPLPEILVPAWFPYVAAVLLALPITITAIRCSKPELLKSDRITDPDTDIYLSSGRSPAWAFWGSVGLAVLAGLGLLVAVHWLTTALNASQVVRPGDWPLLGNWIGTHLQEQGWRGYIDPQSGVLRSGHLTLITFLLLDLAAYLFIWWRFKPQPKPSRDESPALLYLALVLQAIALLGGALTFYFDAYRVPVLIFFVIVSIATYAFFRVDHFFELLPPSTNRPTLDPSADPAESYQRAIAQRLAHQGDEKTLVVVCASGGGIQAAGWTARVLLGLQEELGTCFTRAIALISSVSGGSVGAMYYLNRFGPQGYPLPQEFGSIFKSATHDALDAVGWGMAYPDLWRLVGLPFLADRWLDRGITLEYDWQAGLKGQPGQPVPQATLADWRQQVLAGEIPLPIFNSTCVETGYRFLVSPLPVTPPGQTATESKRQDFSQLYPAWNLGVATASRLSATFPYVSPICRAGVKESAPRLPTVHFVDGGYFDNSGIVSALEWLKAYLQSPQQQGIKRVFFLQINAFPRELDPQTTTTSKSQGWWMAFLGPLLALYRVRDSTQIARNQSSVQLFQELEALQDIDFRHQAIYFPPLETFETVSQGRSERLPIPSAFYRQGKYEPPLSWKLTEEQQLAILLGWKAFVREPEGDFEAIKALWQEQWKMPIDCP